jgi:hypothetical protein
MTLSGLSAAESTTSLNRLIQSLIDPSDALANMFSSLGYESGKAALDANGLYGTMELLRNATGGNIETLLQLFPEIRAARGAFALMAADGENYARTFAGITDETARAGATQRAFNEQMKGLGQQWRLFMNNVEAASIRIGTALIPGLRAGLEAARDFGSGLGDTFRTIGSAAMPTVRAIGDALESVRDALGAAADEISPVARGFATLVGGAALIGLRGLAEALGTVAGFLADHPALVRAVAIAYGGMLIGRLATAAVGFVKLQAVAGVGFTALQKWGTLTAVFSNLAGRVSAFGAAMYGMVTMGNMTGVVGNLKTAFSGLATTLASPAVLGTAFVAALYAWQTGMDTAKRKAQEMVDGIMNAVDDLSLASIHRAMREINMEMENQATVLEGYGRGGSALEQLGGAARGAVEMLTPLENTAMDAAAAEDELGRAARRAEAMQAGLTDALSILQDEFNITGDAAVRLLESMEFDSEEWGDFSGNADKVAEFREAVEMATAVAQNATPAQEGVADAMGGVADATASAADQVNAFNDALEALIGIALGAWDAETRYAQGIQGLTAALLENGTTMDAWTEKGQANRDAMSEAVTGAQEYASAIMEQGGSAREAGDALTMMREQLINTAEGAGMAREEAERLIDSLGLAPADIETLVRLEGIETAQAGADVFTAAMEALDAYEIGVPIELNDQGFQQTAQNIADFLIAVKSEHPEAEITLDGEQFMATKDMVQQWLDTYGNTSEEAQLLLDALDPFDQFPSLQALLDGWGSARATATVQADASPASMTFRNARDQMASWDHSNGTATVSADDVPARASIDRAGRNLANWNAATGTADVNANDNASALMGRVQGILGGWDRSSGSGDVNANDNASGILGRVSQMLSDLDGRTANTYVTNTVVNRTIFEEQKRGFTTSGPQERWGGITNAPTGMRWGGVNVAKAADGLLANVYTNAGAIHFAEPETGGEAFIPRYGNRARALQVADVAAGWHGADVVPRETRGAGGATIVSYDFRPNINVQVRPTVGVDGLSLARAVGDQVRRQVNEAFDELRQEMTTR